jgi:DNA-binding LacI/PurR family transcriptional regulator
LIRYLGSEVQIDVFFHHYDQQLFVDIIKRNLDTYNYYVIMPANLRDIEACIDLLEDDKVYILDQLRPELSKYSAVYQDYENDIYKALRLLQPKIERYKNFKLIYSSKKQPVGILKGFKHFCESQNIRHHVLPDFNENLIFEKDLFLVLNDRHLKLLIKSMKEKGFELARDYGIISFNETVLKEITAGGITTISTDFKQMGKQLSEMILQHKEGQIANISRVKERSSL